MGTNNSIDLKAQGTVYYDGAGTFSGVDGSTATYVLTSNGTGVAPSFQANAGTTAIQTIDGDSGSITGTTVTIYANNAGNECGTSVKFVNSGTTSTLNVTDSNNNTIIGLSSGTNVSGIDNTVFGYDSFNNAGVSTARQNTIIGRSAGKSIQHSSSSDGYLNTVIGYNAWSSSVNPGTGNSNVVIGPSAGSKLETGYENILIGNGPGLNLTTGFSNIVMTSGYTGGITTGNTNVLIGTFAGGNYTSSETNNILLNTKGILGESNAVRIGDTTAATRATSCYIGGVEGVTVSNANVVTVNTSTDQLGSLAQVSVPLGGTGAATLTGLLTGNGTSAITGTAITQYNILSGGASNAPNSIAPSATSGVPLISQGSASQPIFGTAVVAGGGTGATTLTGVLTGNGTSAITANAVTQHGVVIGGASNAVGTTAVGATGTVLIGNTGADPTYSATPTLTSVSFGGSALSTYATNTWTPNLTFGGLSVSMTYSTQKGGYTQIGNVVFFWLAIVLTAKVLGSRA